MKALKYNELKHKVWVLLHHTADLIAKYEDAGFREKAGLSHQQYLILHTMASLGAPVTATDIASKIERNINSISTILDRMEKRGLVQKTRDMSDRRLVRLEITEYGTEKLIQAIKVGWGLIEELLSSYSEEGLSTLAGELGELRDKVFQELYPGQVFQDISAENHKNIMRLFKKAQS